MIFKEKTKQPQVHTWKYSAFSPFFALSWGKYESFGHSSYYFACLGNDLHLIQLVGECSSVRFWLPEGKEAPLTTGAHLHSGRWRKAKPCQSCFGSWFFLNEWCPLNSLSLAQLPHAHQSKVWPCIPDQASINEVWTSNSRIAPLQIIKPSPVKSTSALPHIQAWTSWPGRGVAAAEWRFQKSPIIWCVGEHNELSSTPNGIYHQTKLLTGRGGATANVSNSEQEPR